MKRWFLGFTVKVEGALNFLPKSNSAGQTFLERQNVILSPQREWGGHGLVRGTPVAVCLIENVSLFKTKSRNLSASFSYVLLLCGSLQLGDLSCPWISGTVDVVSLNLQSIFGICTSGTWEIKHLPSGFPLCAGFNNLREDLHILHILQRANPS